MDIQQLEVEWYEKNGRYPDRIVPTGDRPGRYVVGDIDWNKPKNLNGRAPEYIEKSIYGFTRP